MRIRAKSGFIRGLSMFFVVLFLVFSVATVPVYASGTVTEAAYWTEIAAKLSSSSYADVKTFASALSQIAGSSKVRDGGKEYATILMKVGTDYYVGGAIDSSVVLTNAGGSTVYQPITTVEATSNINNRMSVEVLYCTLADANDLQRVVSNVNSNMLSQAGVTPNTGAAMGLLSGVIPMLNVALGLIVTVISIGMTIFSALDIIYLAFPAFRGKIDDQVEGGGKGTKTKKDGSTSSVWVTDDARNAIKETQENQQQPWGNYFKRRVAAYVFLAIILFVLMTGNIFAITTLVTDALSGLFRALGI